MGKRIHTDVLDGALDQLVNNANKIVACSQEPTTFAEANATYALAAVSGLTSGDFTKANGDGAGNTPRKVTVAQKSGTVSSDGTATHVALVDTVNSKLLLVTTCTSQALTNGNPITFPTWDFEIGAPT